MIVTVSNIAPSSCGHLLFTVVVDGANMQHVFHRSQLMDAAIDINAGCADRWDVFAVFLRNHILKYREANPAATLTQIKADIIANFRVLL